MQGLAAPGTGHTGRCSYVLHKLLGMHHGRQSIAFSNMYCIKAVKSRPDNRTAAKASATSAESCLRFRTSTPTHQPSAAYLATFEPS